MVEALDRQKERLVAELVAEAWAGRPFQAEGGFGQNETVVEQLSGVEGSSASVRVLAGHLDLESRTVAVHPAGVAGDLLRAMVLVSGIPVGVEVSPVEWLFLQEGSTLLVVEESTSRRPQAIDLSPSCPQEEPTLMERAWTAGLEAG